MGKMTDAAMDGLLAHIAALTAERDEAVRMRDHHHRQRDVAEHERDALRERVKAWQSVAGVAGPDQFHAVLRDLRDRVKMLEAALDASSEAGREWLRERDEAREAVEGMRLAMGETVRERDEARSSLAAIRQRATEVLGSLDELDSEGARKTVREVVLTVMGESDSDDEEQSAARHGPAGRNKEPTTAEAFATVRRAVDMERTSDEAHDAAMSALALLERRMVAMGNMARDWMQTMRADGYECTCADGDQCPLCRCEAALADAPLVFTLKEVEKALVANGIGPVAREQVHGCLAALRRKS